MKKIAAIFSLMLIAFPLGVFAFTLPDYAKEAKLVLSLLCDQKTTKAELYESSKYEVVTINVKSGKVFYVYYDAVTTTERLFLKTANSQDLEELVGEKWDAALKSESPNMYNRMFGGPSDCVTVN